MSSVSASSSVQPCFENAVHRAHEPGAVRAVLAMDEERAVLGLLQHAHDFDDVFVIDAPGQDFDALGAQRRALHFVFVVVEVRRLMIVRMPSFSRFFMPSAVGCSLR